MNVPSIQGYQYTQPRTISTSWNSESSNPSGTSPTQVPVQYREQRASQGLPKRRQKPGKGKGPVAPPRTFRQPAGARGAHSPYLCNLCGKRYAQLQGVRRHRREAHELRSSCSYCGEFEWSRPYLYKEHLREWHPTIDPDAAVDEAKGAGRRSVITTQFPTNQLDLPHPVDDGGVMHPSRPHVLLSRNWPLPAGAELPISPPAVSFG